MFATVLLAFVATQRIEADESVAAGGAGTLAATEGADLLRAAQSRSLAAQASAAVGGGSVGAVGRSSADEQPVELVMSKIPTDTPPAAPTTQTTVATTEPPTTAAPTTRPPTTRPPTTAAPATPAPTPTPAPDTAAATDTAAPAADPAAAGDTTAPTDPNAETAAPPATEPPATEPPPTEPPAPAHPEGWVNAGHGVFVPPVLLEIRYCESRDNYTAANPSSSARGAYQFLTGSWANYGHAARYGVRQAHLATPAQQDEAAVITWQRSGTRPWNASKHCWG